MELNLNKIKPFIKKYIKEFENIKDNDKINLKFDYLEKARNLFLTYSLFNIINQYTDEILLEYQMKTVNKDISNKNPKNILDTQVLYQNINLECVPNLTNKSKILGSGAFGTVYEIDSKTAVKISKIHYEKESNQKINLMEKIKLEYLISKKAGDLEIGPKVFSHLICKNDNGFFHIILMENLQKKGTKTLTEWLNKNKTEIKRQSILKKIKQKVDKLHKHNIIHSDIWSNNILVLENKNDIDIRIIDFGLSKTKTHLMKKEIENDYINLKYMIHENISMKDYIINRLLENQQIKLIV